MNYERLEHLCVIMQRVIDEHRQFNMGTWGTIHGRDATMCNTAACALGWAALQPECIADGLHIIAEWGVDEERREQHLITRDDWRKLPDGHDYEIMFTPTFKDASAFFAASEYYDISAEVANYLFDPGSYPRGSYQITPEDVIERVKHLIEYGEDAIDVIDEGEPDPDQSTDVGFV